MADYGQNKWQAVGEFEAASDKYMQMDALDKSHDLGHIGWLTGMRERVQLGRALVAEALMHHGLCQPKNKALEVIRSVLTQIAGGQVDETLVCPRMLEAAREMMG